MKRFSLLFATIILVLLFGRLVTNYQERYKMDEASVVLERCTSDSASLVKAIMMKNYLPTEEDAAFAVHHLKSVFQSGKILTSLYDLNKRDWKIPSELINSDGSEYYRMLLNNEKEAMGIDDEFRKLDPESIRSEAAVDKDHSGSISVRVCRINENAGLISRFLGKDEEPCKGVTVRLYEHFINNENKPDIRTLAFARTDASGKASFTGLDKSLSYSVIPIREGYEYGTSKGTVEGTLEKTGKNGKLEFGFSEHRHKVKVFNTLTLKNLKSDHLITVRSLDSYLTSMYIYIGVFFAVWWIFMLVYKLRNKGADHSILSIIMLLTGICLLMMFSMNDPLNDKMIGMDMAQGVVVGIIVMMLLQFVNFTRFYQGRCRIPFDIPAALIKKLAWPFGLSKKADAFFERMPKGFGYMLTALLLTILLFTPLGVAVGGMKVNLNIGIIFQPSEIAKYLIVIFMAAFFCTNAEKIVKFSSKGNVDLFGAKVRMLGGILLGLIFLMGLYLLLGDMGPAMVLAFTFIIMYSIIKSKVDLDGIAENKQLRHILTCDLAMLAYGVASFIFMLYIGSHIGHMWIFCLSWFVLWIGIGLIRKHVFESAVAFNIIIAAFIFGASIMRVLPGLDSVADRLDSRNEMCTNTWGTLPIDGAEADPGENTQVAEGLWGLASGGLTGQGIGKGSPSVIPAFHTDMILSSIGEQIGFLGILVIVILLVMLLRKTIVHGYRTAHPFAFYLCLGIAVVTGVQFIIIALGSTGMIPLTGVTVPFFSFGKVSMILNLAAFGIVLSIAGHNVDSFEHPTEMSEMKRTQMKMYDYPIALVSLAFGAIAVFILGVYLNYQVFERDDTLLRPVYVNNEEGYPVVNYNPRIKMVADKMPIGNIYDRNGVLLASCDASAIMEMRDKYLSYGVDSLAFDAHLKARLRRYYPFGNHLFFMLGDYNTRLFFTSGGSRGYIAEEKHLSHLRGYDDRLKINGEYVKVNLESESYRPGKFMKADTATVTSNVQIRDYSVLLPTLKDGKEVTTEPEDVRLTLDAVLQTNLQNKLQEFVLNDKNKFDHGRVKYKDTPPLRISVVIMDAHKGDLLASAMYPLPDQQYLMSLSDKELNIYRDNHKPAHWWAYTDMDLGLCHMTPPGSSAKVLTSIAALQQEGASIADTMIYIHPVEAIYHDEPRGEYIDMEEALIHSSNPYFVHLLNSRNLYEPLVNLYADMGCMIDKVKLTDTDGLNETEIRALWTDKALELTGSAVSKYNTYMEKGQAKKINNGYFPPCCAWAWGQGGLLATPLSMAQATSVAVNGGYLPEVRFTIDQESSEGKKILDQREALRLQHMLRNTAKSSQTLYDYWNRSNMGGKTGTPEREWTDSDGILHKHLNDGWYVCFIRNVDMDGEKTDLSVALRLERGPASGPALQVTKNVILPVLEDLKYINKQL